MATSPQQQSETLSYFDSVAEEWRRKAEGKVQAVNVVAQRNQCAVRVRQWLGDVKRFLDLGCGTGELTLELAASGIDATGVDFATEMIAACQARRREMGIETASFVTGSVLEYEASAGSFDLIAAMGLIEYLAPEQTHALIARCLRLLRPGGALVMASRNRLFNVFSLSSYTEMEREMGLIDELLAESLAIASARDMASAIAAAGAGRTRPLPQPKSHPKTGIDVNVRYQYTPGELVNLFRGLGFEPATLFPVHYHALPVPASQVLPAAHVQISSALYEAAPTEHRLIPYASTFVIDARKPAA